MTSSGEETNRLSQGAFVSTPRDVTPSDTLDKTKDEEDCKRFLKAILESTFLIADYKGKPSCKVCNAAFTETLEVLNHVPVHFTQNPCAREVVQKKKEDGGSVLAGLLKVRDPSTINNLAVSSNRRISNASSPSPPLDNRPLQLSERNDGSYELPPDLLNFVLERREPASTAQATWYVQPTTEPSNSQ